MIFLLHFNQQRRRYQNRHHLHQHIIPTSFSQRPSRPLLSAMQTATRMRPSTSAPGDGSRTQTITDAAPREDDGGMGSAGEDGGVPAGTLRLRAGTSRRAGNRVVWDENVVDNEGAGKKKSKICCIYHKPRRYDESSSDSSDDSSDDEARRRRQRKRDRKHQHDHDHDHDEDCDPGSSNSDGSVPAPNQTSSQTQTEVHTLDLDDEPNAYERPQKGKHRAT
ncbi:hypothetical protein D9619_004339 [Psilocybe cf. subviscida]|uniref:Type 1 phosphatases regulator n=1 Tax=Psilocybe cf. subviscida TaxID=2480587 RepID=A0A8H5BPR2_9AGAR|nr:hypothetical protein D9619_004339 [Psilocybe cf. subviscida]